MHEKQPIEAKSVPKFPSRTEDGARRADTQRDTRRLGKNPKMKDVDKTSSASCSGDQSTDEHSGTTNPGRIKNLAGFWATQQEEEKSYRKKRLQVDESSLVAPELEEDAPTLLTRKNDEAIAERQKEIEVGPGHAKNIANLFQNRSRETPEKKRPFQLVTEGDNDQSTMDDEAPALVEKESTADATLILPSSVKLRRRIKDLAGSFASMSRDEDSAVQHPREKIIIDRSAGPICSENNPAEADPNITRAVDQKKDDPIPIIETGRTKGLAERWKQQQLQIQREKELEEAEQGLTPEDANRKSKPAWLLELEAAKLTESDGVFENEPEVRSDVVRADDEMPDVISARSTRSARKLWSTIEQEKLKEEEESKIERPISAKSKKVSESVIIPAAQDENVSQQPPTDLKPVSEENAVIESTPISNNDDSIRPNPEAPTTRQKKHRSKKNQAKKLLRQESSDSERKNISPKEKEDAKDVSQVEDISKEPQTSILDERNDEKEHHPSILDERNDEKEAQPSILEDRKNEIPVSDDNNTPVNTSSEQRIEKDNNFDQEERVPKSHIENTRRFRDRKQFDDDDDYFWLEECGLTLSGAALMHVPRGRSHPRTCVND